MLKVECESCKAPYQIDERRVPATGLKMRCPKCGHSFVVKSPGAAGAEPAVAAPPAAGGPRMPPRGTIQGTAPFAAKPSLPAALDARDLDLPAPADPGLPAPVAAGLPARPAGPTIAKRTMQGVAGPAAAPRVVKAQPTTAAGIAPPPGPVSARQPSRPSFDDADLPLVARGDDLPAVAPALPTVRGVPAPVGNSLAARNAGARAATPLGGDFAVPFDDLPVAASPDIGLPAAATVGLPAPANVGLPAAANVGLPATASVGLPAPAQSLPTVARGGGAKPLVQKKPTAAVGFGEIDLPVPQQDLPAPAPVGLPSPANVLPSPANVLPMAQPLAQQLPSAAGSLPPAFGAADDFGELELPRAGGSGGGPNPAMAAPMPDFSAPPAADGGGGLGASLFDDNPFTSNPPPAAAGGDGGFGELELPGPGGPAPGGSGANPKPESFPPFAESTNNRGGNAGGMAFGELDLGGGDAHADPHGSIVGSPFGSMEGSVADNPFGEASLGSVVEPPPGPSPMELSQVSQLDPALTAGGMMGDAFGQETGEATIGDAGVRPRRGPIEDDVPKPSNTWKVVTMTFLLVVLGGGFLELTPYGAFGRWYFIDKAHEVDYARVADQGVKLLHEGMANDVYVDDKTTADKLAQMHAANPRARTVTTLAAISEMEMEMRFGKDPERLNKVRGWLAHDIPDPKIKAKYLDLSLAALAAIDNDKDKARTLLTNLAAKYAGDPILQDVLYVRGELEFRQGDGKAMQEVYTKALAVAPSGRTHFGIARAAFLLHDFKTAAKEINATIAASPDNGNALLVRATMTWNQSHDDSAADSALKDLAALLDGALKNKIGDGEAGAAYALRGEIQRSRGRTAEAREAFDAALKRDPRNEDALIGQGDVLYDEGRYSEAVTRFDVAVSVDPNNPRAVVGAAKTQIALEHHLDAKTALQAAQKKFPKSAMVMRWLAEAEARLGNKVPAEKDYQGAIDLVDPTDPDAIEPYAAYATFLNSLGRADEAATLLGDAQKKLPDSPTLQRALGDVAIAQGRYDDAIANFNNAIAKDKRDVSSYFHLEKALRMTGRLDEASKMLDQVEAADKNYPNLALERGLILRQGGKIEEALDAFKAALAKTPNDPDLKLAIGGACVLIGKPDEAEKQLRDVLRERPNSNDADYYLGRALLQKGPLEYNEAMRHLKLAMERDPNNAEYHLWVGVLANILPTPDMSLAKREINKALELNANLADGYLQRGVLEFRTGDFVDSVKDENRALGLRPASYEAHAWLAQDFEKMNQLDQSTAHWHELFAHASEADRDWESWNCIFGKQLVDRGTLGEAVPHLKICVEKGENDQPRPGRLKEYEFAYGMAAYKLHDNETAKEHLKWFLDLGDRADIDRPQAMKILASLGAPYEQ